MEDVKSKLSRATTGARLVAWQIERAPTTGQLHVQGYLEFANAVSFKSVKSKLYPTTHIEARAGTAKQAFDYCVDAAKRAADVMAEAVVDGEPPSAAAPGRRTDLELVRASVDAGESLFSISQQYFGTYLRYSRGIREYQLMARAHARASAPRTPKTVIVYWGPSGSGKSRHIDELWPGAYRVQPGSYGNVWWTGYDGQDAVVLDDFYCWLKVDFLLRLLDYYPVDVPIHGGLVPFTSSTIVFSSNVPPKDWYPNVPPRVKAALLRRLEFVYHVDYSAQFPCIVCQSFPHQVGCQYVADALSSVASSPDSTYVSDSPNRVRHVEYLP